MTNDTLVLETEMGSFHLTREDKGPIITSGNFLEDEYCLKRVHFKGESNHKWRGSLRTELLDEKLYLDIIFNGKVTETVIVIDMLLAHRVELSFLIAKDPPM
jgi:hypothetical protein